MQALRVEDFADQGWRLNNLYMIVDKAGTAIPFRMNWAQQELFEGVWYNNIILKARQLGFSTFIDLLALDNCLFSANYSALVIAHKTEAAEGLFDNNIRFPYEHIVYPGIKERIGAERASVREFKFSNGSSIKVDTSGRSGTNQFVHISEFGKLCAKYPDKAKEIVSGTLQTVAQGNLIFIESTAEGSEGYFYDYCQNAKAILDAHKKPSKQDFKFFFFPWWRHPEYKASTDGAVLTDEDRQYFREVEGETKAELNAEQRAFYLNKKTQLQEDIYREYPSTPDEAFKATLEGAYYTKQLAIARQERRIGKLPLNLYLPVNTFWDIGVDDYTAIWLHQRQGSQNLFVGYIEAGGESLNHFADKIFDIRRRGGVIGDHYLPHDARNRSPQTGKRYCDLAMELGLSPINIVDTPDLAAGIQQVRSVFSSCWFDEEGCAQGLIRLQHYRRQWSDTLGAYISKPRHDEHSHGADAFRMFAQGYRPPRYSQGNLEPDLVADY